MAKRIKAIKCPQCGSVQKTQIQEDRYRCNSCTTEYFIDSDDINVNVKHTYNNSQPNPYYKPDQKKTLKVVGVVLAICFAFPFIIILFNLNKNSENSSDTKESGRYSYRDYENTPVEINGKAYIVCFGSRSKRNNYNREEESVYYFYNIEKDKIENITKLDITHKNSSMRTFADGNCYLVLNEKLVYKLNKEKMLFDDFTQQICDSHKDFSSGFASIKITYPRDGCAFDIMSNVGKEYKYYPIAKLVLDEDKAREHARGIKTLLPDARDSTYYMFTKKGFAYYGEGSGHPIQLISVTFKYNAGGPQNVKESEQYDMKSGTKGVALFYPSDRIVSYKDVTPERMYFEPHIAYMGNNDLLINVRANAAKDSPVSIQKINVETGEVIWATLVRNPERRVFRYFDESIRIGDKYIVKDDKRIYLLIDTNGKLIKEINLG